MCCTIRIAPFLFSPNDLSFYLCFAQCVSFPIRICTNESVVLMWIRILRKYARKLISSELIPRCITVYSGRTSIQLEERTFLHHIVIRTVLSVHLERSKSIWLTFLGLWSFIATRELRISSGLVLLGKRSYGFLCVHDRSSQ